MPDTASICYIYLHSKKIPNKAKLIYGVKVKSGLTPGEGGEVIEKGAGNFQDAGAVLFLALGGS